MNNNNQPEKKHQRRILLLAPQPFYQDRGTPIAVRYVIEALTSLDYVVDLLTFPVGQNIDIDNLNIYRTYKIPGIESVPIGFSFRKLVFDFFLFFSMWGLIRRNNYACIYAVEEASFFALIAKKITGLPVIYDMQSCMSEQLKDKHAFFRINLVKRVMHYLENLLIRGADTIVCSSGLKSIVCSICPRAQVYEWFFPGLDARISEKETVSLRKGLSISSHEAVIIYTGNSESYQGIELLLESAPVVTDKHPNAVFLLVGIEQYEILAKVSSNVRQLIISGTIKCIGKQSRLHVGAYLSLADVAVSPRKDHGNLPLKIFDYIKQGLPIVVTDIAAHHQILNTESAEIVGLSSNEIAVGINRVLSDHKYAERLAYQSRAYANKQLGKKEFISQIKDILASTV